MSLWSAFAGNLLSRPALKPTHYFHAYESHLERFRERSVTMIEIGVWRGGSLQMWKKYLGPSAQIVGIDIDPECKSFEEPQVAVRIGDQADPAFLQGIVDEFGPIDIVLDDGSHRPDDIAASFAALYPQLERNGVYIVEDTRTSYMPDYDGGLRRPGTFMESVKGRLDELHGAYSSEQESRGFQETTRSVTVYDGLVVFERGRSVESRILCTVPDKARRERDPVL